MKKAYSYIRFSSKKQEEGDSFKRQTLISEKYCEEHGLDLDKTLNMTDKGLSAFTGKHKSQGALGGFLKKVEAGEIEKGSYLLIENIDRLSRLKPTEALRDFDQIIHAGITVVTLQSGMTYSEESINTNQGQLYVIVGEIQRANAESERKRFMLRQAWERKRKNAYDHKIPMTGKCPLWLKLNKETKKYERIPDRCKTIEMIFQKKLEGKSKNVIAQELNCDASAWKPDKSTEEKKSRNKTGGWRGSYIQKIFTNREVIGEYQPYLKKEDGKRVAIGEPIPDFYPKAFEDTDLFYRVQNLMKTPATEGGNSGGNTSKAKNLFVHLAKCGFCGSALHYIDKGKGPKGGKYLQCDASYRKLENREVCTAKPIIYSEFERIFFENMEKLDVSSLLPQTDEINAEITANQNRIQSLSGQIKKVEGDIENIMNWITNHPLTKEQSEAYFKADSVKRYEKAKLQKELNELIEVNKQLLTKREDVQTKVDSLKQVRELLEKEMDEKERIKIRTRLRSVISDLVEQIIVYPAKPDDKESELKVLRGKLAKVKTREAKNSMFGKKVSTNALTNKIKKVEADAYSQPNIVRVAKAKSIKSVGIYFRGQKQLRIIPLITYIDLNDIEQE